MSQDLDDLDITRADLLRFLKQREDWFITPKRTQGEPYADPIRYSPTFDETKSVDLPLSANPERVFFEIARVEKSVLRSEVQEDFKEYWEHRSDTHQYWNRSGDESDDSRKFDPSYVTKPAHNPLRSRRDYQSTGRKTFPFFDPGEDE